MRRLMQVGMVVALALVLSACLTQEQQTTARASALGDSRFQALLSSHPYSVTRVAPREKPAFSLDEAVVEITFAQPVAFSSFPADSCGTVEEQPFTGVRWLVDLKTKHVAAVSQILANGTSCLDR